MLTGDREAVRLLGRWILVRRGAEAEMFAAFRMPLVAAVAVAVTTLASPARAAVELCDGSWSTPAAPQAPQETSFQDLAVLGNGETWAVGGEVISHRRDGRWTTQVLPGTQVRGVAARPGVAYAVGSRGEAALVLRNTGSGWTAVPVPIRQMAVFAGLSVSMTGPDNVWVAGAERTAPDRIRGVVLHFNGTAWRRHLLPPDTQPRAVDTLGPRDTWVVGSALTATGDVAGSWHWDGRSWDQEIRADFGDRSGRFNGVSALPDGTVWAVGAAEVGNCCDYFGIAARRDRQGWVREPLDRWVALSDVLVGRDSKLPTVVGGWFAGDGGGGRDAMYLASQTRPGGRWWEQDVKGYEQPPSGAPGTSLHAADSDGHGGSWVIGSSGGKPLLLHRCLPVAADR